MEKIFARTEVESSVVDDAPKRREERLDAAKDLLVCATLRQADEDCPSPLQQSEI